jgi:polysaccharide transporter, PST family
MDMTSSTHSIRSVVWLTALQALAMTLPLLSMPILARALGVAAFGQVMWALGVSILAVVWVDAGLNGESQRQMALSNSEEAQAKVLWCNLGARSLLALPAVLLVLLAGAWGDFAPMGMLIIGLLQVLGTLLFVQWWWLARAQGASLGLLALVGRALSVLAIYLGVQGPQDAAWAMVCMSSGAMLSGILGLRAWLPVLWRHRKGLHWHDPVVFLRGMRFAFLPSFAAAMAHNAPILLLGWLTPLAGQSMLAAQQVAWYAAADRLSRAAAHVSHGVVQTLLNMAARPDPGRLRAVLVMGGGVLTFAVVVLCFASTWIIELLYGVHFLPSVHILQLLLFWWGLYVLRQATVAVLWGSQGQWRLVARLQWQEACMLLVLSAALTLVSGAFGVALALVLNECGLLLRVALLRGRRRAAGETT